MREILFRGKDNSYGKWVEGFYTPISTGHGMEDAIITGTERNCFIPVLVIPETVGQYTGLTDTNGTKIFEGDVVRLVYNCDEHIYQVVYDVSELDFKATNGKEEYRTNYQYLTCCDEVEVIGNIHDNPELAEGLL